MIKALIAYCLAVTLALVGVGVVAKGKATALEAEKARTAILSEAVSRAAKQRKQNAAVLASRATENAATARKAAALEVQLSAALAQEREWADAPVPDAVRQALEVTE